MSRFQKQHLRLGRLRLQPERHHPGLQWALPLPGEPAQRLALLPEPPAQLPGDLQRHPSKVPMPSLAADPACSAVRHARRGRPRGEPDRAQPPGRPALLPYERRGPAGHRQPVACSG